jgi:metal-responsive CopG/Arc/MetJ family transcriptional regulator
MNRKRNKKSTKRITITFTKDQLKEIDENIGPLGNTTSQVVRYIVIDWLRSNKKNEEVKK